MFEEARCIDKLSIKSLKLIEEILFLMVYVQKIQFFSEFSWKQKKCSPKIRKCSAEYEFSYEFNVRECLQEVVMISLNQMEIFFGGRLFYATRTFKMATLSPL